jgi:hypothetical protein
MGTLNYELHVCELEDSGAQLLVELRRLGTFVSIACEIGMQA